MSKVLGGIALLLGLAPGLALASSEGGGGFINLDRSLLIQIVNLGLFLFFFWKFLYRPFLAKLDERSQAIKKSLSEAQAAQAEAERQREEHRKQLQAAYAEAQSIREAALKEAAEEQRRLVEGARAEAGRLGGGGGGGGGEDVRRARQELRQEVADLAVGAAERLIRKSLRGEEHRKIVTDAIAELERTR